MDHYTLDNTQGYDQEDLDALNADLDAYIAEDGCEPYTPAWYDLIARHQQNVANR